MSSKTTYLKEYQKPQFKIHTIELDVQIFDNKTVVNSTIDIENLDSNCKNLFLNGEDLAFKSLIINDRKWAYELDDDGLTILDIPKRARIHITNEINPFENFKLEGFYKSGDILCSQCESEGFRRITYYLDRPDVMASFSTRISADKKRFPYLLSNGNLVESGELEDERHFAVWKDPHLKPCYLFAMVAGDLAKVTDSFTTRSGKNVDIEFFVQHGNENKTHHAIDSLKNAMKWDEEKFGLEYDLDIYMVVAVDSFNAGAMENKGLNIFNSQYVLADQNTATDQNFLDVEGVIAHEYFHNWTGNRVTCRDWFQLTLKEGLTVYRDQEFSADMNSRPVQRMFDVRVLKEHQYAEDSGPTSHPIRPEKYIEINNFYTTTVYNKGAEVIRMIEMFIGKENFRKGIDIYFENFDGQAVTTEDFIWAMEKASGFDFTQFKRWYSQSGTPTITFEFEQDFENKILKVKTKQSYKEKTNDHKHEAFQIPVDFALIGQDGDEIKSASKMLNINQDEQEFIFDNISEKVYPSLLRRFSAPVKIETSFTDSDLIHLAKYDTDEFNRYEAVQRLFKNIILDKYNTNKDIDYDGIISFVAHIIEDRNIDSSLKSEMLTFPGISELVEDCEVADYLALHQIRDGIQNDITNSLYDQIESKYLKMYQSAFEYDISPKSMAKRKLQNVYLNFLSYKSTKHIKSQYKTSTNMTDSLAAFSLICNSVDTERQGYINAFADKWKNDFLVMNKWFVAQSTADHDDCFNQINNLLKSEYYDSKNPNNIRSVLRAFARNYSQFHRTDSIAYQLMADKVLEIDSFNSSIASNISLAFRKYSVLPEANKTIMKPELERILNHKGLSKDVDENISRIYKG